VQVDNEHLGAAADLGNFGTHKKTLRIRLGIREALGPRMLHTLDPLPGQQPAQANTNRLYFWQLRHTTIVRHARQANTGITQQKTIKYCPIVRFLILLTADFIPVHSSFTCIK
jgi:hypothetical protein